MPDRVPPHDNAAERAVIGIGLTAPNVVQDLALTPEDFYQPAHAAIFRAVGDLAQQSKPTDPEAVADLLRRRDQLRNIGGLPYLAEVFGSAPISLDAGHYARIVSDLARRRAVISVIESGLQAGYGATADTELIIGNIETELAQIVNSQTDNQSSASLDDFLSQPRRGVRWVIPDLLGQGERLIITGAEGLGKTTLIRQLAICAAAGMSPFHGSETEPMVVLVIDAENPRDLMIDRFSALRQAVIAHGGSIDPRRLWIIHKPEGVDLADPRYRLWLQRAVRKVKPHLIVLGPVYKLFMGGTRDRDEDLARKLTATLDAVRGDAALILEHHAPHAAPNSKRDLRPIGSSLWLRWPEFGFGIRNLRDDLGVRRSVELVPWRGGRDERKWPERLESGGSGMPWVEAPPQ